MTQEAEQAEKTEAAKTPQEISGLLGRARALLAMAHRHAAKLPLEPADRDKSKTALAQAIGLCVNATHGAKANSLFKLMDSGLNPSEIRHAVQRGLTKPAAADGRDVRRPPRPLAPSQDRSAAPLLAQLDACRRMNVEGLRWLAQSPVSQDDEWRGNQLLKIAEQLCVITALESKLLGVYVMGASRDEPPRIRKAVFHWATEATRKELDAD